MAAAGTTGDSRNSKDLPVGSADTFWQTRWRRRLILCGYLAAALALWLGIRPYTTYVVPLAARHMLPEYPPGTRLLVHTHYRTPERLHRGDCVIYEVQVDGRTIRMIGRAVGWPGETAGFVNGALQIDGQPARETYLKKFATGTSRDGPPVQVPPGGLYVLNDVRADGVMDSRDFGPVAAERIIGKVVVPISTP